MKARFYVIDSENNVSYSTKKEASETFSSERAALRRAKNLAASEPGKNICVCKTIALVQAPIGKIEVAR